MTQRVVKDCKNCKHPETGRGKGVGHFVFGPCKDLYCRCPRFVDPEA